MSQVLSELVGDKSLDRFRQEYEKLHRALKKSHENEKRLIKKCRELNQEIVQNAAKVQTALRLSTEDRNNLALLKREIDKAWKMVDAATEREARARDTIQQLKTEIQNLGKLVNEGAGLSIGQENTVNDLLKMKAELQREVETQAGTIVTAQKYAAELSERVAVLEKEKMESEVKHRAMKEDMMRHKADGDREGRRADRLENEMKVFATRLMLCAHSLILSSGRCFFFYFGSCCRSMSSCEHIRLIRLWLRAWELPSRGSVWVHCVLRVASCVQDVQRKADIKDATIASKAKRVEECEALLLQMDIKMAEEGRRSENFQKAAQDLRIKNVELENKMGQSQRAQEELKAEKRELDEEIRHQHETLREKNLQILQMTKASEKMSKEKEFISIAKAEAEKHRDALKAELIIVQKELEHQLRVATGDEKTIVDLNAQVKKLTAALITNKDANITHAMEVGDLHKKIEDMDNLIIGHKTEEGRLRKINYELEKQREKAILNASTWHAKYAATQMDRVV